MLFRIKKYRTSTGEQRESSRVQCLRVFSDEILPSGQPRRQVIMTVDRWAAELPDDAKQLFTGEEQAEWAVWKVKHDEAYQRRIQNDALADIHESLSLATKALRTGAELPVQDVWQAVDQFVDALAAAGCKRPRRPRGRPRGS